MAELEQLLTTLREYRGLADTDCLTLPPAAYFSADLQHLELERIFRREWLCVGREEQVPKPGDYYTVDLIGEPVVVVRGEDGVVRALNTIWPLPRWQRSSSCRPPKPSTAIPRPSAQPLSLN